MVKNSGWLIELLKNGPALAGRLLGSRPGLKLLLLVLVPAVAVLGFFSQARCAVVVGEEVVAVAVDRQVAEGAVKDYIADLENEAGLPVALGAEIKYRPIWRLKTDSSAEIRRVLAQELEYQYGATGIFVDGRLVVAVKDKETGRQVLDQLLHMYDGEGDIQLSFKQKVELKPVQADTAELMEVEQAVEHFRFGGVGVRTYEVQEGDTLWDIASAVRLPVDELVRSNPELNPDTLAVGQEIKISKTRPLVDVVATYTETRQEKILYQVQEKVDDNLFLGERKVVQRGRPGQREVVYKVTTENGVEVNKEEIRATVLEEPVHQVVAKGSRKLLAFRGGNGRLAYPTVGGIVSHFGSRWGRSHLGVDIAANHGSPVVAAEAGTVLRVGYHGGYGLRIDISHGGGVVTRYAHLSSAAVKSGQRVERGQFIGRAGSTGNTTGPHLHFEVMVNGVHKNPALFI